MVSILVTGILIVLALTNFLLYNYFPPEEIKEDDSKLKFQGPVPEGYDLKYYQETGITKLLGEK